MRLLLRKIAALTIAAGLALSGATPLAHAKISTASHDMAAMHESHAVAHYADLAIEADGSDCAHAVDNSPNQPSHHDGPCTNCCAACVAAGLVPDAPLPGLISPAARAPYAIIRTALVAHLVPTDPGIPKKL